MNDVSQLKWKEVLQLNNLHMRIISGLIVYDNSCLY